jgi:hypothetical protein
MVLAACAIGTEEENFPEEPATEDVPRVNSSTTDGGGNGSGSKDAGSTPVTPRGDGGNGGSDAGRPVQDAGSVVKDASSATDANGLRDATVDATSPGLDGSSSTMDASSPNPSDGGALGDASTPPAPVAVCGPQPQCPADVKDLGVLSGDTDTAPLELTGHGSALLRLRITEDAQGLAGRDLRTRFSILSPAAAHYGLVAYHDADNGDVDATECSIQSFESHAPLGGSPGEEVMMVNMPDRRGLFGHDDSTNVTIEIRFLGGSCVASDTWTLRITGNAP